MSERGGEDFCDVWVRCGTCGHEPDCLERREDVWGSLDGETIVCLTQDWNGWAQEQAAGKTTAAA